MKENYFSERKFAFWAGKNVFPRVRLRIGGGKISAAGKKHFLTYFLFLRRTEEIFNVRILRIG